MSTFQIGDVVTLKSGGPKMTVTNNVSQSGKCQCEWFLEDGKPDMKGFPPDALQLYVENAPEVKSAGVAHVAGSAVPPKRSNI